MTASGHLAEALWNIDASQLIRLCSFLTVYEPGVLIPRMFGVSINTRRLICRPSVDNDIAGRRCPN